MNRGMVKAKTPRQQSKSKHGGKSLASAVGQILGIGIVAGAALILGTEKTMKKFTEKKDEPEVKDEE